MQNIYPTEQFYTDQGSTPGGAQGPNDGQDTVSAATVNIGLQQVLNTLAYLAALTLGMDNAPPTAEVPLLVAAYNGAGSGVGRIQSFGTLPSLASYASMEKGDVAFVALETSSSVFNARGLFYWNSTLDQSHANGVTILASTAVGTGCWVWVDQNLMNVAYGIAGLDSTGRLSQSVLPCNFAQSSVTSGTFTTTSSTLAKVTNGSTAVAATITPSGHEYPITISLVPDPNISSSIRNGFATSAITNSAQNLEWAGQIVVSNGDTITFSGGVWENTTSGSWITWTPTVTLQYIPTTTSTSALTFTLWVAPVDGSNNVQMTVSNVRMIVKEG